MSDVKWKPSEEQREVVLALKKACEECVASGEVKSQSQFVRNFLNFTESKFSKILDVLDEGKAGSYFDDIINPAALIDDLRLQLDGVRRKRDLRAKVVKSKILPLTKIRALKQAVDEAGVKDNEERIIQFVAPTRGGKTKAAQYLMFAADTGAVTVEASRLWRPRGAYRIIWLKIFKAFGLRCVKNSTAEIEDDFIEKMRDRRGTLVIDEAEHCGADALFIIRTLANKTRLTLVLLVTPEGHKQWLDYFEDAYNHVAGRTHAIIDVSRLNPADVVRFFAEDTFQDAEKSAEYIAEAASVFGHWSLVARVQALLQSSKGARKSEVEDAVAKARRQIISDGGAK